MIGPFKPTLGGFRYVYVAIDKFSKWIEYKPLVLATAKMVVELFEDIIHRFGLPNSIITDLETTFTGHHFWDLIGAGIPILRQVVVTIVVVDNDTSIRL